MKKILLTASAALMILFAQAQTLCDYTYTSGSQYQLDVAIGVTGNGLPKQQWYLYANIMF